MKSVDEDSVVSNGHYEVEVIIDRPASQVWTPLLDDTLWVTTHGIQAVSGELGSVGFITRVSSKTENLVAAPPPHYHYCKLIKLVPEKQYVLKSYSEKGGSYGAQMTGFDDTRLVAMGDRTKVIFNIYWEARSEALAGDLAAQALNSEVSRQGMITNLNNLKRSVESR
jgi:hypothetical protein